MQSGFKPITFRQAFNSLCTDSVKTFQDFTVVWTFPKVIWSETLFTNKFWCWVFTVYVSWSTCCSLPVHRDMGYGIRWGVFLVIFSSRRHVWMIRSRLCSGVSCHQHAVISSLGWLVKTHETATSKAGIFFVFCYDVCRWRRSYTMILATHISHTQFAGYL